MDVISPDNNHSIFCGCYLRDNSHSNERVIVTSPDDNRSIFCGCYLRDNSTRTILFILLVRAELHRAGATPRARTVTGRSVSLPVADI